MARLTSSVDPGEFAGIIGQTFIKHERQPLLVIGSLRWNRQDLGKLGIVHPVSARALTRVCAELRITSIAALARHLHEVGNYKGLGETCYFLCCVLLRTQGYNVVELHGDQRTYLTLKARARRAQKDQKKRRPRRAGPPSQAADASV
jgi:hypothetical protein